MKNLTKIAALFAAMGLISFNAMAQKTKDVPQTVQTAFSTKYPLAHLKDWKIKKNDYLAFFSMNNKKYDASYSKNGSWLITERDIRHRNSLPSDVRAFLKTGTYASWYVDDMKRVRTPKQNVYQIMVDNHSGTPSEYEGMGGADNRTLYFGDNGKLLKVIEN
jgi:hypothetical protein